MPRYVDFPHYNPDDTNKHIKFLDKNSLIVSAVREPAGRLGLRKNDVVTHFRDEKVQDYNNFIGRMKACYKESKDGTSPLVVNADMATATQLQERAQLVQLHFMSTAASARAPI